MIESIRIFPNYLKTLIFIASENFQTKYEMLFKCSNKRIPYHFLLSMTGPVSTSASHCVTVMKLLNFKCYVKYTALLTVCKQNTKF